jgi:hypothetical protein
MLRTGEEKEINFRREHLFIDRLDVAYYVGDRIFQPNNFSFDFSKDFSCYSLFIAAHFIVNPAPALKT